MRDKQFRDGDTQVPCNTMDEALEHYRGREIQIYGLKIPQFQDSTTNRDAFKQWEMPDRPQYQPAPARPHVAFEGNSTYNRSFPGHQIEPRGPPQPPPERPPTAKFDAYSSYSQQFKSHPIEARPPVPQPPPRPHTRFEGSSTYKDMHNQKEMVYEQPPAAQYEYNPLPFDASSSYKSQFQAHQLPERPQYQAPPAPPRTKFEGTTTNRDAFVAHQIEPQQINRSLDYNPVKVPFDGKSSYADQFQRHELPDKPQYQAPPQPPRTKFEGTTTNRDSYVAPGPEHFMQDRSLPPQYQPPQTKFEGVSEMSESFKRWQLEARPPPQQPPMRPQVPFEGSSTTREAFKGWQLPKNRPSVGVMMVGDQMHVVVPKTDSLPASGQVMVTTVHDNQAQVSILVCEGEARIGSNNALLGVFDMEGIPPGPKGKAQIMVTFEVDKNNVLSVHAREQDTQRHCYWIEHGRMLLRDGSTKSSQEIYSKQGQELYA